VASSLAVAIDRETLPCRAGSAPLEIAVGAARRTGAAGAQIWTHKEAYLKGMGRGLAADLAGFATALGGGPVADDGEGSSTPWFTRVLAAPAGYKAALAAPLRPRRVCDMRCAPDVVLCSQQSAFASVIRREGGLAAPRSADLAERFWRFEHSTQARKWCRRLSIAEPEPAADEADFARLARHPESQASAVRSSGKDPGSGGYGVVE
jgi:hypothetical protein